MIYISYSIVSLATSVWFDRVSSVCDGCSKFGSSLPSIFHIRCVGEKIEDSDTSEEETSSCHVRYEIVRYFAVIVSEFPNNEADVVVTIHLYSDKHIFLLTTKRDLENQWNHSFAFSEIMGCAENLLIISP